MQIISGTLRNRVLVSPKGPQTRPTSALLRAALFNICQQEIGGIRFLDLFAGSGAMGLEALSRGAIAATFVENDRNALIAIRKNIASLEVTDRTRVLTGDVFFWLKTLVRRAEQYAIVYADPPYTLDVLQPLVSLIARSDLIPPGGSLFVETAVDAEAPVGETTGFHVAEVRQYGRSLLHQYIRRESSSAFMD